MNVLKAAETVLKEAGTPLHYTEITQRMIADGRWKTNGKTPERTVNSTITKDIKNKEAHSLFQRTDEGVYALRIWKFPNSRALDILLEKDTLLISWPTCSS